MVGSTVDAEVDVLTGVFVVVLPRSCVNTAEQKEIADMIARVGAKPSGGVKPGRGDLVVVGRAPLERYRTQLNAHVKRFKTDVDVLTCDWLESCLLCNGHKQPLPRHYVYMCINTAIALAGAEGRDECAAADMRVAHVTPAWFLHSADADHTLGTIQSTAQHDASCGCRYGTDMQLEPSVQDTRVMLLQQVPLIDECARKTKVLEGGSRGRRKDTELQAAAERRPAAATLQQFSHMLHQSPVPQIHHIAARASLLGQRIVLLFLPMELTQELPATQVCHHACLLRQMGCSMPR